jgi:hypothetical protein
MIAASAAIETTGFGKFEFPLIIFNTCCAKIKSSPSVNLLKPFKTNKTRSATSAPFLRNACQNPQPEPKPRPYDAGYRLETTDFLSRFDYGGILRKFDFPINEFPHSSEAEASKAIYHAISGSFNFQRDPAAIFGSSGFRRQIENCLWKLKVPKRSGPKSLEVHNSGKRSKDVFGSFNFQRDPGGNLRKFRLPKTDRKSSLEVETSEKTWVEVFGSLHFRKEIERSLREFRLPKRSARLSLEVSASGKRFGYVFGSAVFLVDLWNAVTGNSVAGVLTAKW